MCLSSWTCTTRLALVCEADVFGRNEKRGPISPRFPGAGESGFRSLPRVEAPSSGPETFQILGASSEQGTQVWGPHLRSAANRQLSSGATGPPVVLEGSHSGRRIVLRDVDSGIGRDKEERQA